MNTRINANEPSIWFAWKPVLAENRLQDGTIAHHIVWLQLVRRSIVRIGGASVFKHEIL